MGTPLTTGVLLRLILILLASLVSPRACAVEPTTAAVATAIPRFESDIRPIFREYCFDCHGATEEIEGGMDLRLVRFLIQGGDSGPAIEPGNAAESNLLSLVRSGTMPPGAADLPADKVATIERWIAAGAPIVRPEPETIAAGVPLSMEDRSYWAYQPIVRPQVPELNVPELNAATAAVRTRTPIDALIQAAMPEGLTLSPDAPRGTLIKRAYFDLVGLPPTAQEQRRWLEHPSPTWFDEMLESLLDSPHYGERWARHWLDVAGYADSDGYTLADAERPWAWKYRDYVIRSLNADKPFDRFVTEQLAGDELAGPKQGDWTAEQIELLTATGFLRTAADGTGSGDNSPEARNKVIADSMKIVGTALLGSSLHCAQCHDHRYDPISHLDYTAIRSVFEPAWDWQQWRTPAERLISLYTEDDRGRAAEIESEVQTIAAERQVKQDEAMAQALEQELSKYEEPLRESLRIAYQTADAQRTEEQQALLKQYPSVNISPGVLYQYLPAAAEELKKFDQRIADMRSAKPPEEFISALTEPVGHTPLARLFHRGEYQQPKNEVVPAGLSVTAPEGARAIFDVDDPQLPTSGRRLAFARWLTAPRQPLLARVLVNRIWMHHFGQGLVATPGEFGKLGSQPTHPELLDWLAAEFVAQGWSVKQLHRMIMKSSVWRQSSQSTPEQQTLDPDNRFLWRKPLQRLDAEIIRDRMLASAERLNCEMFGPPLAIKEDETGQIIVDGSQTRRSLYIRSRRTQPVAMLQAFDAPVMDINCEFRPMSTVATQSLIMLNGEFCLEQAGHLADLAARSAPPISEASYRAVVDLIKPSQNESSQNESSQATNSTDPGTAPATDPNPSSSDPRKLVAEMARAWELALCRPPEADELRAAVAFAMEQLSELKNEPRGLGNGRSDAQQVLVNVCHMLLNTNEFLYLD